MKSFGRKLPSAFEDDAFESALADEPVQPVPTYSGLDDMFCAFDSEEPQPLFPPRSAQPDSGGSPPSPPCATPPRRKRARAAPPPRVSPSASMALYAAITRLGRPSERTPAPARARGWRAIAASPSRAWPVVRTALTQLLEEAGADPDYSAFGCEPLLFHALTIVDSDLARASTELLLQRGADAVDARTLDGRSMLDVALELADGPLARMLLAAGSLPTARALDSFGKAVQPLCALADEARFWPEARRALDCALASAVEAHECALVRALLRHGAAADARAAHRAAEPARSVLHTALASRAPRDLVRALLEAGASAAPVDEAGGCALWPLVLRDDGELFELLLAAGAAPACDARDEAMGMSIREYCGVLNFPNRNQGATERKGRVTTAAPPARGNAPACAAALERADAAEPALVARAGPATFAQRRTARAANAPQAAR
jgi:hypothetical protein